MHENICITRVAETLSLLLAPHVCYFTRPICGWRSHDTAECDWRQVMAGGDWRNRARYVGVDTSGGDGSEMETVTKEEGKQQSTTSIDVSLTPDLNDQY